MRRSEILFRVILWTLSSSLVAYAVYLNWSNPVSDFLPFYFGGTALLIVVGVAIDTIQQIESHMITRHYEGFLKKGGSKTKGRF